MLKLLPFLMLMLVSIGCHTKPSYTETGEEIIEPPEILDGDYEDLGNNLFADQEGNLYFRTIDRSASEGGSPVKARYSNRLYFGTVISGENTYVEKEMKDVVDRATFKKIKNDPPYTYYRDKNHEYSHLGMADGGSLCCSK